MTQTRSALRQFATPRNIFLAGILCAWAIDALTTGTLPFCRFWPR